MNRESMIAERIAKGLTAKTVNNERDMLSELNDLQRKAQEWEKDAKDAVKAGKLDELTAKRYEKLSDYLEGAWVTMKAILDTGKLLVGSSKTAGKWPTVKAMRMDLTAMLDQFEEWMEKEKEAVENGKAGFDFRPYYQTAFDAIEDAEEKVKKVENHV